MSMVSRSRRGFTIVEMFIVLAALGLLLGSALIPYAARHDDRRRADEREAIAEVRAALVEYAARTRTVGSVAVQEDTGWLHPLPAGRPYLPCPDLDGDGLEDRFPAAAEPGATVTLTRANDWRELAPRGGCESDRGLLPWRTIGVEPADTWGNLRAYRVHPSFSNRAAGFDHLTRADGLDETGGLQVGAVTVQVVDRAVDGRVPHRLLREEPGDAFPVPTLTAYPPLASGNTLIIGSDAYVFDRTPFAVCATSPNPLGIFVLREDCGADTVAGAAVTASLDAGAFVARFDPPRDGVAGALTARPYLGAGGAHHRRMTEGVAFAVVSFGKNGHGAPRLIPADASGPARLICAQHPRGDDPSPEVFHVGLLRDVDFASGFGRCRFPSAGNRRIADANVYHMPPLESARFTGATSPAAPGAHDDIVAWMGPDELVGRLARRRVFPVAPLPPIGLPVDAATVRVDAPPPVLTVPGGPASSVSLFNPTVTITAARLAEFAPPPYLAAFNRDQSVFFAQILIPGLRAGATQRISVTLSYDEDDFELRTPGGTQCGNGRVCFTRPFDITTRDPRPLTIILNEADTLTDDLTMSIQPAPDNSPRGLPGADVFTARHAPVILGFEPATVNYLPGSPDTTITASMGVYSQQDGLPIPGQQVLSVSGAPATGSPYVSLRIAPGTADADCGGLGGTGASSCELSGLFRAAQTNTTLFLSVAASRLSGEVVTLAHDNGVTREAIVIAPGAGITGMIARALDSNNRPGAPDPSYVTPGPAVPKALELQLGNVPDSGGTVTVSVNAPGFDDFITVPQFPEFDCGSTSIGDGDICVIEVFSDTEQALMEIGTNRPAYFELVALPGPTLGLGDVDQVNVIRGPVFHESGGANVSIVLFMVIGPVPDGTNPAVAVRYVHDTVLAQPTDLDSLPGACRGTFGSDAEYNDFIADPDAVCVLPLASPQFRNFTVPLATTQTVRYLVESRLGPSGDRATLFLGNVGIGLNRR